MTDIIYAVVGFIISGLQCIAFLHAFNMCWVAKGCLSTKGVASALYLDVPLCLQTFSLISSRDESVWARMQDFSALSTATLSFLADAVYVQPRGSHDAPSGARILRSQAHIKG